MPTNTNNTNNSSIQKQLSSIAEEDLLAALSKHELEHVQLQLDQFVLAHHDVHRPICLVTSGGTAVDLEQNAVRCLDNFSTGLRGAVSVEEFLQRGYAVVHLWREGSAAPYARVLSQYLGLKQSNHGLNVDCLGKLFAMAGEDTEDDLVQTVLQMEKDSWLTNGSDNNNGMANAVAPSNNSKSSKDEIVLHRAIQFSSSLQRALRERSAALREGRLLTIPFRTIDEYLAKLQLAAQTLAMSQSLAMFFLAAAVSDFYIPASEKAEHKIQSGANQDGLTLHLRPVPKIMGLLRDAWAPNSFVVSFKLETDVTILRQKAERAVEKYGCHMVIGNLLQSRHDKVNILAPDNFKTVHTSSVKDWNMTEIVRPRGASADALESSIIDFVVQSHFEYISYNFHHSHRSGTSSLGMETAKRAHRMLREKKKQVHQQMVWKQVQKVGVEVVGALLAVGISYAINTALQKRRF